MVNLLQNKKRIDRSKITVKMLKGTLDQCDFAYKYLTELTEKNNSP